MIQSRSLYVQRNLFRSSIGRSTSQEVGKIGRDESSDCKPVRRKRRFRAASVTRGMGWRPVHQISDRRCSALPSSEWMLIDPGAEAEKERWPGEDPVQHAGVSKGVVIGY